PVHTNFVGGFPVSYWGVIISTSLEKGGVVDPIAFTSFKTSTNIFQLNFTQHVFFEIGITAKDVKEKYRLRTIMQKTHVFSEGIETRLSVNNYRKTKRYEEHNKNPQPAVALTKHSTIIDEAQVLG